MELRNNICVVSLTHWDREWRFPLEKTRALLVEMMDGLLELLDNDPDYTCFHLDGQTILLEDYCEVRPENKEKIRQYVREGRLFIGPWLVLPEENQMSGESLVRNFLWGERIGRDFGGNMKVGYSPTSWGQVSQMPQIMQGFGVDSIIFYRGINPEQIPDNYYIWQGPDGSKLLGVRLGMLARVVFFQLVDRPIVFDRTWGDESHEWQIGGKPYRLCGSGSATPYEFSEPPFSWHSENIEPSLKNLEEADLGKWSTDWALACECDDCTGPFVFTPKIIKAANKLITNDKQIKQGNLPEFIDMARRQLDLEKVEVIQGEMRHPEKGQGWTGIYAEIQSCRIPTKYANRRAEFALQRVAEPLAVSAWGLGFEYPKHQLENAYYLLLQSHAHDSIGGCGRDVVDEDVQYRLRKVELLAGTITEKATRCIAGRIDTAEIDPDEVLLVVFNSLPRRRSQVVEAEFDFAQDRNIKGFRVCDASGAERGVQVISKQNCEAIFNHPWEVPCRMASVRWSIRFLAEDIPAMGYKVFRVIPAEGEYRHVGTMLSGPTSMENEHLCVTIQPNGTAEVTCNETGQTLTGLNSFEDRGEAGDYWLGATPTEDRTYTSLGCNANIAVVEKGTLSTAIEARITMTLPACATEDASARSTQMKELNIRTVYRLNAGERFLRIETTIENNVEDHRLRAIFPSDIKTDIVRAETAFDVVERQIPLPDTRDWTEPCEPVQPHLTFVDLSDGKKGVALMNKGLPQYEAVDDARRTLALTLLRSHRAWNSIRLARYANQFGTQLQGTHTFEYAVLPHKGDHEAAEVMQSAESFNVDPIVGAAGPGKGDLPVELSLVELRGTGLVLSGMKKGEWDDSLVLRVANPTTKTTEGELILSEKPAAVEEIDMMESKTLGTLAVKDRHIELRVPPKKVMTLRITQR